jgi:hypothetical protein
MIFSFLEPGGVCPPDDPQNFRRFRLKTDAIKTSTK